MLTNMASSLLFWITLLLGFIVPFLPYIIKNVLCILYQESESERHLRRQLADLKLELQGIDMVDEFAKHAKIQRKINKLRDELTNQNKHRLAERVKGKFVGSTFLYSVCGILVAVLNWQCGNEKVLNVPAHWLYPIDSFVLMNTKGVAGLNMRCWFIICLTTARVAARYLK